MGMTKIYGCPGVFRKLFVSAIFFPLVKRYGFSQVRLQSFEARLNRLPHRTGIMVISGVFPGFSVSSFPRRRISRNVGLYIPLSSSRMTACGAPPPLWPNACVFQHQQHLPIGFL
jgi:hypothetical protein